jgi:uncharacterized Tic20 family protein
VSNENETIITVPSQDERIMAALAHVTAILPFMGVIAPIVIWATQKEKSPYIAFQALQALVYQLTMILAWFAGMACYMCSFFGTFAGVFAVPLTSTPSEEVSGPAAVLMLGSMLVPFIVFGLIMMGGIVFVVYGLAGAVQVLRGRAFRYAIIGARLERYLQEGERVASQQGPTGGPEE